MIFVVLLLGPVATVATGSVDLRGDWRTARRDSAGLAPAPATTPEPVVQVYAARAFAWRGAFAVHTWIAAKRGDAPAYRVYEVVGWHTSHGGRALQVKTDLPDRYWYGARPEVLVDRRGAGVEDLIDAIEAAAAAYLYPDTYRTWPGPNSNTFSAYIGRRVPELGLELPPTAIGKDYLTDGSILARSPAGSGFQISLYGVLGVLVGLEEGLEFNLLSLSFGIDPLAPAVKFPGLGTLGFGRD